MGSVEEYLKSRIMKDGAIHFTLLDPEKVSPEVAAEICLKAENVGTAAILVGGSTLASPHQVEVLVQAVKGIVHVPVILFPGNISGISRFADAVLFMSLLNSSSPYFLVGAQALGAPLIKKYQLEAIPMGYIIMGSGGTAGFIGYAHPIPYDKGELAAAYALAAQYMGMRLVYLEAGSGALKPIPPQTIAVVRRAVNIPLIVGGGIRTSRDAQSAILAGASIIVTGTIVERKGAVEKKIGKLVKAIRRQPQQG